MNHNIMTVMNFIVTENITALTRKQGLKQYWEVVFVKITTISFEENQQCDVYDIIT